MPNITVVLRESAEGLWVTSSERQRRKDVPKKAVPSPLWLSTRSLGTERYLLFVHNSGGSSAKSLQKQQVIVNT